MKQEPRPVIQTEEQLVWIHKLGEAECLGISRAGQTVLAMLMQSQIWHQSCQLCGSVWEGSRKGTIACLSAWSKKPVPSSFLDARHFTLCLYATGGFQAATLMLEVRGVSLIKSMCVFLMRNCLGLQKFPPLTPSLLVFAARNFGDLPSWHWNPGL